MAGNKVRLFVMGQLQELAAVGGSCRKPRLHSEDADGAGQRRKEEEEEKGKKKGESLVRRVFSDN